MWSQSSHQGSIQTLQLPSWIWKEQFPCRICLVFRMDPQKTDLGPWEGALQKDVWGNIYFALRILYRRGLV
jgi:hypothetical protein